MKAEQYKFSGCDFDISDVVITKKDELFYNAVDDGEEEIKKAGTRCVVAEFSRVDGVLAGVILEKYDQIANKTWLTSIDINDVECVWRVPR